MRLTTEYRNAEFAYVSWATGQVIDHHFLLLLTQNLLKLLMKRGKTGSR